MMNVSTSTSGTSTAGTAEVNSTQTQTKTNENTKTSEKSFDEEMKNVSAQEETTETSKTSDDTKVGDDKNDIKNDGTNDVKDNVKTDTKAENNSGQDANLAQSDDLLTSEMLSGGVNFTDFKYHNENQSILSQNIQNLLNTKDLMTTVNSASAVDYDVVNMSDNDASFFANLVQNTDMSMKDIAAQVSNTNNTQTTQSVQVSSVLMEKLAESLKTNQPFRIDFDKDVSVIIKVNKDGSLAANFIPGDKAVEQYLRNNIASLRQRFDDENLPYSELSYANSREQRRQGRKKENNNNE